MSGTAALLGMADDAAAQRAAALAALYQAVTAGSQAPAPGPGLLGITANDDGSTDAPWVQNLKRLVHPDVDPRALVTPRNRNTDPGLNRLGPRVGDVLGT